jgi:signal transduction histidine kinase
MHSPSLSSLPRRLVSLYLMVCLGCLLFSVAASLFLAAHGALADLAAGILIVPLVLVLGGAVLIRRAVTSHVEIEDQLRQLALLSPIQGNQLQRVSETDPIGIGWNAIVERFSGRSALERLEARLEVKLRGRPSGERLLLLDVFPEGLATTDASGKIVFGNKTLKALLRITAEQDVSRIRLADSLLGLTPEQAESIHKSLRNPSRPSVFELKLGQTPAEGILRIARYPLNAAADAGETHLWSIRDVTQQKLAEEMRNQFVATATHELRTPLSNIKAYAETLAEHEDIDRDQQRGFFNVINSEATRLGRFIDELLNVSQMESGALSLSRHETDILRLTEEAVAHVQPELQRKQIEFHSQIPPKLPNLHVDKEKLAASLVNLLGNAAKYTPAGGRVRFQVEVGQNEIHFHVEDTGIGIAREEIPKLFDKFFRSDDQRVREITGSGLGLSFTQEVARLHGGQISVQSELNKGSRFTLSLPLQAE